MNSGEDYRVISNVNLYIYIYMQKKISLFIFLKYFPSGESLGILTFAGTQIKFLLLCIFSVRFHAGQIISTAVEHQ